MDNEKIQNVMINNLISEIARLNLEKAKLQVQLEELTKNVAKNMCMDGGQNE